MQKGGPKVLLRKNDQMLTRLIIDLERAELCGVELNSLFNGLLGIESQCVIAPRQGWVEACANSANSSSASLSSRSNVSRLRPIYSFARRARNRRMFSRRTNRHIRRSHISDLAI